MPDGDKLTPQQFAQKIKAKYPDYQSVDDTELVNKMLVKYPEYKDQIDFSTPDVKKKENSNPSSISSAAQISQSGSSADTKSNTPDFAAQLGLPSINGIAKAQQSQSDNNLNIGGVKNKQDSDYGEVAQKNEVVRKQNLQKAINNTAAKALKLKGINAPIGSPQFNEQAKKIEEAHNQGNISVGVDDKGEFGMKNNLGTYQSTINAFHDAIKGNDDAQEFVNNMTPEQRVQFLNKKNDEFKNSPYIGNKNSDLGEFIGGSVPFMGKAIAGGVAGMGIAALAPETGGASLAALPALGSFLFTAHDAANDGALKEIQRRYQFLKEQNPNADDVELMKQAGEGINAGRLAGLVNNAILTTTHLPLGEVGKTVLGGTLGAAAHMGLAAGGTEAAKELYGKADGIDTPLSDIVKNSVDETVKNATVGSALHLLTHGAFSMMPKAVKSAIKYAVVKSDANPAEMTSLLKMNEDAGKIPQGTTQKVITDLNDYKQGLDKIPPNLSPETEASVTGLLQAKNNIIKEMEGKDKSFHPMYKEKIAAIDDKINNIVQSGDPLLHEQDDVTGEPLKVPDNVKRGTSESNNNVTTVEPNEISKPIELSLDNKPNDVVDKSIPSEPTPQEYTTKTGNHKVIYDENGNHTVIDKEGNPVVREVKNGVISEMENPLHNVNNTAKTLEENPDILDKIEGGHKVFRGQQKGQNEGKWFSSSKEFAQEFANKIRGKGKANGEVVENTVHGKVLNFPHLVTDYANISDKLGEIFGVSQKEIRDAISKTNPALAESSTIRIHSLLENEGFQKLLSDKGFDYINAKENLKKDSHPVDTFLKLNDKKPSQLIVESYHNAKKDGSNPELVKSVEDAIGSHIKRNTVLNEAKTKTLGKDTERKVLREAANNYDFTTGKEVKGSDIPNDLNSDEEVSKHIIEHTTSPVQLAQLFKDTLPLEHSLNAAETVIKDMGVGKVMPKSFERFGDKNNVNSGLAKTYLAKDGASIDEIAREMTDHSGVEVTPQDVVDFMQRFPNGIYEAKTNHSNPIAQAAKDKFYKLTGLPLTDHIADIAIKQPEFKAAYEDEMKRISDEADYYKQTKAVDLLDPHVTEIVKNGIDHDNLEQLLESGLFNGKNGFTLEDYNTIKKYLDNERSDTNSSQSEQSSEPTSIGKNSSPKDNKGDVSQSESVPESVRETKADSNGNSPQDRGNVEDPSATSIKNEQTDKEREKRGLPPAMESAKKDFGTTWDEAMKVVDDNPAAGQNLVNEIINKPRPLTDVENAVLLHHQISVQNSYDKVADRINSIGEKESPSVKDQGDLLEQKQLLAKYADDLAKIYDADKLAGTENARGLATRKMMAKNDYSLAAIKNRAKAANDGNPLSPEQEAKYDELHKKYLEASKKLEEYESRKNTVEKNNEEKTALEKFKKEAAISARKDKKAARVEVIQKERENLKKSIRDKWKQYSRGQLNAGIPVPVELIPDIIKVAKGFVEQGILEAADAIKDIAHLTQKVINELDLKGVDAKSVRDTISGYGKTMEMSNDEVDRKMRVLKQEGRHVSAMEDVLSGEPPKRSGLQREKPTDEQRRMKRELDKAIKDNNIQVKDPEQQLKTALDAVKTRLRNSIADLDHQLKTGEKTPKKTGVTYDDEANNLKAQRDGLKDQLEAIEGTVGMSDEMRIETAKKALLKSTTDLQRRIDEKDFSKKQTVKTPETPELVELKKQRDALKSDYQKLMDAEGETTRRKLEAYKKDIEKRTTDLQRRIDEKDFSKKVRPKPVGLDREAFAKRAEFYRTKRALDTEIEKQRIANQNKYEKGLNTFVKWERAFKLSNPTTIGKLFDAAVIRIISSPIEEGVGGILSHVPGLSQIAKEAPSEGGFNARAEAKVWTKGFMQGLSDAGKALDIRKDKSGQRKSGMSDLEVMGESETKDHEGKVLLPPEAIDFFGHLHTALKAPAKRMAFERSYEKRAAFNISHGIDNSDPMVQAKLVSDSYKDAKRAIFMQDNLATDGYKHLINYLENSKKYNDTGKTVAAAMKFLLPFVKVPTNVIGETFTYTGGTLIGTGKIIAAALGKGIKEMTPEQKDSVMRCFKKGSIGLGLLALGFYNPENVGGYYQDKEKREEGDVKAGELRLFGTDLPKWAIHSPLMEVLQIGATMRRVADHYTETGKDDAEANAVLAGLMGITKEAPFIDQPERVLKMMGGGKGGKYAFGELVKSTVDPAILQFLAKQTWNKESKPAPETIGEHVESGIPYLNRNVPSKDERENQ